MTVPLFRDSFKIATNYNIAGRFNCLRQPGQILHNPKVYHAGCTHLLYFLHREQSCIRDKVYGAVGRRAVVMVFASPSAKFCTGSNPRRLSGLSHRDNFIMTANLSPLTGTVQEHMPTLTRSATKSTSGPSDCLKTFSDCS